MYVDVHISNKICLFFFESTHTLSDENFYPFGFSAGDFRLSRIDDGSSGAISLFPRFRFFGRSQFRLYVSQLNLYSHKMHDILIYLTQ